MRAEPLVYRAVVREMPSVLRSWRAGGSFVRWDRHYLVKPLHSLALVGGDTVEVRRHRVADGFRFEQVLLRAAFPLDWMSLALIASVLPRPFAGAALNGRDPQALVDSLAFAGLPQASVLKAVATLRSGAVVAQAIAAKVPDLARKATFVAFESMSAAALRALREASGLEGRPHVDFDEWLRDAHRDAASADMRAA